MIRGLIGILFFQCAGERQALRADDIEPSFGRLTFQITVEIFVRPQRFQTHESDCVIAGEAK